MFLFLLAAFPLSAAGGRSSAAFLPRALEIELFEEGGGTLVGFSCLAFLGSMDHLRALMTFAKEVP